MRNQKGFTFIETLIVIGIVVLLATAVIITINPIKRFEATHDRQREIHVQSILSAVYQYRSTKGEDCPGMPDSTTMDPVAETELPVFRIIGTTPEGGDSNLYYDLYDCLLPFYLDNPIFDPKEGDAEDTRYQIWKNLATGRVTVVSVENTDIFAGPEPHILELPTVVSLDPKVYWPGEITHYSARAGGDVTDEGGVQVWESGVVWSKQGDGDPQNYWENHLQISSGLGSFDAIITDLVPGTAYYIRAYAKNDIGVAYGDLKDFTTLTGAPAVETRAAEHVTHNTAELWGAILSVQSTPVTAYFCWQEGVSFESDCPNYTEVATGIETEYPFSATIDNLNEGGHVFKACGVVAGTGDARCGEVKSFVTEVGAPHVVTLDDTQYEIGSDYAVVKGQIVSDGGLAITKLGFCYNSTYDYKNPCGHDPYTSVKCVDAPGYDAVTGYFSATIPNPSDPDGLEPGWGYNVCAFASNGWEGNGLSYGGEVYFETVKTAPVLTTKSASRSPTSPGSAVSGGIITSDGGELVTQRGVCWESSPSIPNKIDAAYCTDDGIGKGDFTSNIAVSTTGLWADRVYNVRAYAINAIGTSWADNVEELDTATSSQPTLSPPTTEPTEEDTYTDSIENVGGNITDHGGAAIGKMGICWSSTNDTPTLDGAGCECKDVTPYINLGEFYTNITGLYADTAYYVRAYAQNAAGISYDQEVRILRTARADEPIVATYPGTTVVDTGGDWVKIGGEVIDTGGDLSIIRGACYSGTGTTNPTYEIEDGVNVICDTEAGAVGLFEITITGLPIRDVSGNNITYYALAFANNSAGSAYGFDSVSFEVGRKNGESCTDFPDGSKCNSGFCADGVCCDAACTGTCKACVASKTDAADGTCADITFNTDPDKECIGTCRVCKSGICQNATANTDPNEDCSETGCGTGYCSGGSSCGYMITTDGKCPKCKTCVGADSVNCENRDNLTQDTTSPGTCSGVNICYGGECVLGKYYLYITTGTFDGNLEAGYGSARIGADARCQNESTNNTKCKETPWAFLSVDGTDEIYDFQDDTNTNSVITTIPWFWAKGGTASNAIANNFDDLLDGTISHAADSVGYTGRYWTGSNPDGHLNESNCLNWTKNPLTWTYKGRHGESEDAGGYWLTSWGTTYCRSDVFLPLICACLGI